jgi:hypothetical protein
VVLQVKQDHQVHQELLAQQVLLEHQELVVLMDHLEQLVLQAHRAHLVNQVRQAHQDIAIIMFKHHLHHQQLVMVTDGTIFPLV